MKSFDATSAEKAGILVTTIEEAEESQRDYIPSSKPTTSTITTHKERGPIGTLTFKSPTTTPRVPNDLKASAFNAAKLLNARKSHDITYLTKHQKKSSNELLQSPAMSQVVHTVHEIKGLIHLTFAGCNTFFMSRSQKNWNEPWPLSFAESRYEDTLEVI